MPDAEPRWDIGEQVVVRTKSARPLVGVIASSSMQVVFAMLTVAGASPQLAHMSNSRSVLEVVRVPRKDGQREARRASDGSDTQRGLSTGRLTALFPVLFEPIEEEDEGEPFFMS